MLFYVSLWSIHTYFASAFAADVVSLSFHASNLVLRMVTLLNISY